MKPFLVLQHLDVEHPGVLRECMRDEGIGWDTVELDQESTAVFGRLSGVNRHGRADGRVAGTGIPMAHG